MFNKANIQYGQGALKLEKLSSEEFVNPKEPASPFNKSNTGKFDGSKGKKQAKPPVLRKTSTMVSDSDKKLHQSNQVISSRF